jgi:DNA-binding NarL/FixJ family response regulator
MAEPSASRIRVYLIDGHAIVRESLALVIVGEQDVEIVGAAGPAAEALNETRTLVPDVVVLDLNVPDSDGIELLGALRAQLSRAKLLVLTAYDDEYSVAETLRAGADGYLLKSARREELVDAIRRVHAGGTPLSPRIAVAVLRAKRTPRGGGVASLTARELQVLRLLASGLSIRETATRLTISPKTVETHRVRIYAKLNCKSAVELTRIAVRTRPHDASQVLRLTMSTQCIATHAPLRSHTTPPFSLKTVVCIGQSVDVAHLPSVAGPGRGAGLARARGRAGSARDRGRSRGSPTARS